MKPETTAIVLVDDNNDFLSEGGRLHLAVKSVLDGNNAIGNMNDLMRSARRRGVLVIHVPIMFSPDYREMGDSPYGIFKVVKESGAFQRGTWGAAVAEVLETHDSDIVVEGKSSTCAFASTDLKEILVEHGIRTIALGGLLTNICIESTMRTAYDMGYEVYTLTDCAATVGEAAQNTAIEFDWPMFSKPVTHGEFLERLRDTLPTRMPGNGDSATSG
jgi:ureidoacrylate peracid hydrolase